MALALIGGTFDPLHAGHLAYIRAAQRYGYVMAAVSDSDKHPPLVPLADRVALLKGLGISNVVACRDAYALRAHRPDYYIKGEDWYGKLPAEEVAACEELGIEIIYTNTKTQSSSEMLRGYSRELDRRAVKALESFVQGQPAPRVWEPVTDYSLEGRRAAEGDHPRHILRTFNPCRVLDAGCGPGHLLRLLNEASGRCRLVLYGIDTCFERYAPPIQDDRILFCWGDIAADEFSQHSMWRSDLVICREVLEHLTVLQIARAVRNLVRLSSKYLYITTRFHESPSHLLNVQDHDDLDPTHISLLTKPFLRTLFVLEGCKSRPDLEARLDWKHLGRCLVFEV